MAVLLKQLVLVTFLGISFSSAFLESLFPGHGYKSNPDVFCIMEHCGSQSTACLADGNCRSNMECMTKCGMTNHSCMYECMNTYEDKVFDAMMKCMVDDFQCLTLEPPNPNFRCTPPKDFLKNFTMSRLTGPWYIVRGLNRDYDCFDCQISTYTPVPNSKNYTVNEKYDVTMLNGSIRHRVDIQQVEQKDTAYGGMMDFTNTIMGLTMYEKWQVMDIADAGNYMIVYYCGHMTKDWWYEGNLVYSRDPTLGPIDVANVAAFLKNTMGHTMDQYCVPNTKNCISSVY